MRASLLVLAALTLLAGGCIGTVDEGGDPSPVPSSNGTDEDPAETPGSTRDGTETPDTREENRSAAETEMGPPENATGPRYPWIDGLVLEEASFQIRYEPEEDVEAKGSLTVWNPTDERRETLVMKLSPFTIESVENADGTELEYSVSEGLPVGIEPSYQTVNEIEVSLAAPVGPGEKRSIHLAYSGWFDEALRTPSGPPHEFTSNFHARVTPEVVSHDGWSLPGQVEVEISHPEAWTIVPGAAPGEELEVEADGWTGRRYTSTAPRIPLYSAQAMEVLEDTVNGTLVRTYHFPDSQPHAPTLQEVAVNAVETLSNVSGAFPREHVSTVPFPSWNSYARNELTLLSPQFYRAYQDQVPVQFGRPTPHVGGENGFENFLVHEHSHQSWGYDIQGTNYDQSEGTFDGWFLEGFATYVAEIVYIEQRYGEQEAAEAARAKMMDQKAQSAAGAAEQPLTEPGEHTYHKSALAMRSLRAYGIQQGQPDAVLEGIERIQAQHGTAAGGIGAISTEDVKNELEHAFGEELDAVLDPWLYTSDVPDLAIGEVSRDGENLTVTVANPSPVPAAAHVRAETVQGGASEGWGFAPSGGEATIELEEPGSGGTLERVTVDPDHYVYESNEANNEHLSDPATGT